MKRQLTLKSFILIISDLIVVNLSFMITLIYRLGYDIPETNLHAFFRIAPWICVISILVFFIFDLYGDWVHQEPSKIVRIVTLSVVFSSILIMSALYLSQNLAMPRTVTVFTPAMELLLLGGWRLFVWKLYHKIHGKKKVLIIGEDENDAFGLAKYFSRSIHGKYIVSHFLNSTDIETIEHEIKNKNIDAVVMRVELARQENIISVCIKEQKEILIIPDILAILLNSAQIQSMDDSLILTLKADGNSQVRNLVKRIFDLVFATISLIILSPIMISIALIIPFTSPGPAFYRQERLGIGGKPFRLLKFRSMVSNAELETGPTLALANDPRITEFGAFLRASRLDELPQLINVLKGEMSLIGPRPEREFFVKQYLETVPYYGNRMIVKPGITGLAQIMGKYNTSPEDKLRFDIMYIRNYSFLLDLRILLYTFKVLFEKDKTTGVEMAMYNAIKKMVS